MRAIRSSERKRKSRFFINEKMINNEKLLINNLMTSRDSTWVSAVGKHREIWDYSILGDFESCFNFAWAVLRHELKLIDTPWYRFEKELKKSNGYIGQFAEIKRMTVSQVFDSGVLVGSTMIIFDNPSQVDIGLSKPVFAGLTPGTPNFLFAPQMYREANPLKSKGENRSALYNDKPIEYTNYPLIITDSPFVLSKVNSESLIGAFVPNILSIASVNRKSPFLPNLIKKEINKQIYQVVKPCPKKIVLIEEMQRPFCFSKAKPYTVLEDYSNVLSKAIEYTNQKLNKIGSSICHIEVETSITSSSLVEIILQAINSPRQRQNKNCVNYN